ncbi:phage holin family protein [Brevibacillus laterosporus]
MANELLSILENAGRIGLPAPDVVKRAVEVLKDKGEVSNAKLKMKPISRE